MQVTTEKLPNCQIALTVTPDPERVEEGLKRAARQVAAKYNIPGYRKGKAPYAAVVRAYGKDALYEQMVEDIGDEVYRQALEESGLNPIAPGELKDVTFDPLVFHLVLSMPPDVDLGDYRSVRVERPVVTIDEARVDREIAQLRESYADWAPVKDNGAQYGDLLTMSLAGVAGDGEIINDSAFEIELQESSGHFPPGFDAHFVGARADDALSFDLTYPDDWPSARAGVEAHFDAVVQSVKRKDLPPLDDDLAPLVGEFDTMEELRNSIRDGLLQEEQSAADDRYGNEVLSRMVDGAARLEYPEVLLDDYTERIVHDRMALIRRLGVPFNDYLRIIGETEAQFRADAREAARNQLQGDLVLEALQTLEHIHPSEEEITSEIERLLGAETQDTQGLREMLESESGRHAVMHNLERRDTVRRVMAIADGTAPSLEEAAAEAAARAAQEAASEPAEAAADEAETAVASVDA